MISCSTFNLQMEQLHIVLLPFMASGHVIPMIDMARLFISRGLRATIITTSWFIAPINMARHSGLDVGLRIVQFPPDGSPLPNNVVSFDQIATSEMLPNFFKAVAMLQGPVEGLLRDLRPHCLISDVFLTWTAETAAKLGIPRLAFHGTCCFSQCVVEQMHLHKNVGSDSDHFIVPNLPHEIRFAWTQTWQGQLGMESPWAGFIEQVRNSDSSSYGVVFNSFHELEPAYVEHYKEVLGRKAWHIGPLLLCNEAVDGLSKAHRGGKSAIDEQECLAWLDSKNPNSVVYICHGSIVTFTRAQFHETAAGLEASGLDFIWVVRKGTNQEGERLLPEGFEERMKGAGKGLIIWGWAPQLMILNHPAVGAFLTHCGWNSILEGICAGIPLVTWPVFADQFSNEKLATEILRIGVSVGNKNWQAQQSEGVPREAVMKAVQDIMTGESAGEMRSRAKYYREAARRSIGEGGSSLYLARTTVHGYPNLVLISCNSKCPCVDKNHCTRTPVLGVWAAGGNRCASGLVRLFAHPLELRSFHRSVLEKL